MGGDPLARGWSDEIAEWANECLQTQGQEFDAVVRAVDADDGRASAR